MVVLVISGWLFQNAVARPKTSNHPADGLADVEALLGSPTIPWWQEKHGGSLVSKGGVDRSRHRDIHLDIKQLEPDLNGEGLTDTVIPVHFKSGLLPRPWVHIQLNQILRHHAVAWDNRRLQSTVLVVACFSCVFF